MTETFYANLQILETMQKMQCKNRSNRFENRKVFEIICQCCQLTVSDKNVCYKKKQLSGLQNQSWIPLLKIISHIKYQYGFIILYLEGHYQVAISLLYSSSSKNGLSIELQKGVGYRLSLKSEINA